MSENKTGKYFKYAIGEIILVVIGILIALQINNWNNNIKRVNQEVSLLQNMMQDIDQDISTTNNIINIHDTALKIHKTLEWVLLTKNYNTDSIPNMINGLRISATPTYSSSTYNTILGIGLNIIQNDSLRNEVLNYYELVNPYVNSRANIDPKFQFQELLKPYYLKYFKRELNSNDSIIYTIHNSKNMFADKEFLNELSLSIYNREKLIMHHKDHIIKAQSLTNLLNDYITQKLDK